MSKGNLILGFGRGSVGDVTLYRAYGEQVARARNRHPSNPKSDGQLIQRAIMATVMRAYSLGQSLFDHSHEGLRVGQPNQSKFLSDNAKLIRTAVINALNTGQVANFLVCAPGVNVPVPNAYVVSSGKLVQDFFTYGFSEIGGVQTGVYKVPAIGTATTIGEYCQRNNLVEGDIYTFLGFFSSETDLDIEYVDPTAGLIEGMSIAKCVFAYEQLRVKAGARSSETAIDASTKLGDIFEVYKTSGMAAVEAVALGDDVVMADVSGNYSAGAWGVIRSREDSQERSNCTLNVQGKLFGIKSNYLLNAWKTEGSYGNPELILDGSNFLTGAE